MHCKKLHLRWLKKVDYKYYNKYFIYCQWIFITNIFVCFVFYAKIVVQHINTILSSIGIDYSWVYLCGTYVQEQGILLCYRSDNVCCDFLAHKFGGSLHQQLPSGGQPERQRIPNYSPV